MRAGLIAAGGVVAVCLGFVQLASMSLYGDLARPPAVPALLPPSIGVGLGRPLQSRRVPATLRSAYAAALLHRGDVATATAIVAGLPDGTAAFDLRGQLAEGRGDPAAALPWYARARDFEGAQRLIDAIDASGRSSAAAALEEQLAAALGGSGDAGVRARAFWRLGQITQEEANAAGSGAGALALRALSWYERALELAPNDETYLLAAGRQALTLGDKPAARRYYERALEAVPNSADAHAGLAQARS